MRSQHITDLQRIGVTGTLDARPKECVRSPTFILEVGDIHEALAFYGSC
jgi:hypothetical protein